MALTEGEFHDNSFYGPLAKFESNLRSIKWRFPCLPALVNALTRTLIAFILCLVYLTVGIAAQMGTSFQRLMEEAREQMKSVSAMVRSGYAVAIGIYFVIVVPLWLIQLPFQLIGMIWGRFGLLAIIPIAAGVLLAVAYWSGFDDYVLKEFHWFRLPWSMNRTASAGLSSLVEIKIEHVTSGGAANWARLLLIDPGEAR